MSQATPIYDIVIVGGGNAGCVLAARLSECPELKVLLLEAGKDHSANPSLGVPAGGKALWADSTINWAYQTLPQDGYEGRSITHHRGKGLGGTTLVNLNCMTFPDRESVDNFEAIGNPGWSYGKLQPYYRKFHTYHEPSQEMAERLGIGNLDASTHGTNGPVQVSYGNHVSEFQKAWIDTFKALGKESRADPLSGNALGAVIAPGSVNPAGFTRSYAAAAYLTPEVKARSNLEIFSEAVVEKIILSDGSVPTATGVRYSKDGITCEVRAANEVLLCGGVFNSPQLLELSEIGAKEVLAKLGIVPKVELSGVGENLQDHNIVAVSLESTVPTFDSLRDPATLGAALQEYAGSQSGPFTSAAFSQSFMPCMSLLSDSGKEQIQNSIDKHMIDASPALRKQYELVRRIVEDPNLSSVQYLCAPVQVGPDQNSRPVPDENRLKEYFTLFASLSHPFSRGTCHASSSKVNDPPAIDPKYFSHPTDVEIMSRHLQYLDTIASTKPLANLVKPGGLTVPTDLNLSSLDYTRELVKTGFTTYHPCGTCAMMAKEDGGVVDSRLQVYGVKGLRVVDASIFPLIPRGNIQSSVYAVAERAADLIKEDLGLLKSEQSREMRFDL